MSKFKQLCQIYNQSHNEIAAYLDSCVHVIQQLVLGLETYLGIPEKRIQFRNEEGEEKPVHEAMYLENGRWHFDAVITMCPEDTYRQRRIQFRRCYYPRQVLVVPLALQRLTAEHFIVSIADYPTEFKVDIHDQKSFTMLYETIFEVIQLYYQTIFHLILERGESPLKVEFKHREFAIVPGASQLE